MMFDPSACYVGYMRTPVAPVRTTTGIKRHLHEPPASPARPRAPATPQISAVFLQQPEGVAPAHAPPLGVLPSGAWPPKNAGILREEGGLSNFTAVRTVSVDNGSFEANGKEVVEWL